jgi:hypothetical protein
MPSDDNCARCIPAATSLAPIKDHRLAAIVVYVLAFLTLGACGSTPEESQPESRSELSNSPNAQGSQPSSPTPESDVTSCSEWVTTESDGYSHRFTFRADGFVDYQTKSPSEDAYREYEGSDDDSRWKQEGASLSISLNAGTSTYEATVGDDKLMDGSGHSQKDGSNWSWTAICDD